MENVSDVHLSRSEDLICFNYVMTPDITSIPGKATNDSHTHLSMDNLENAVYLKSTPQVPKKNPKISNKISRVISYHVCMLFIFICTGAFFQHHA